MKEDLYSFKERAVSDAIIEKPIEFSISYPSKKQVEFVEKVPCKFLGRIFSKKVKLLKEVDVLEKEDFKVYTPSIGKLQILSKLFLQLELDFNAFQQDPATALFNCCAHKTDVMAEIMAVSIFKSKDDLLNSKLINQKKEFFKWHCNPADFSIIVGAIITQIDISNFLNSIRLTKLFRLNDPKENGANRVENQQSK